MSESSHIDTHESNTNIIIEDNGDGDKVIYHLFCQ